MVPHSVLPASGRGRTRILPVAGLLLCALMVGVAAGAVSLGPSSRAPASPSPLAAEGPTARGALPAVTPSAGSTLSANAATPSAIGLSWSEATCLGFSNYEIEYSSVGSGGPFVAAGDVTTETTTELAVGSLSPGATFWWEVIDEGCLFGSQTSNVVEAVQPTLAYLTHSPLVTDTVQFNWTNNASYGGALTFDSYEILETSGGAAPTLAATVANPNVRTANVTGLSAGTSYSFYLNTTDCLNCATTTPTTSTTTSNPVTIGTPLPLTVTVTAFRTTVDVNQSDLFACTSSGGASPFSYAWMVGGGSTFTPGNSSLTLGFSTGSSSTVTESVTCRVTDHDSTQATGGTTIFVNPDPSVTVAVNRTSADVGEPVSFACTASGGTPSLSVNWSFADGQSAATGVTSHAYSRAGAFVPTCTAVDGAGVVAVGSQSVTVSSLPAVAISAPAVRTAPGTSLGFVATAESGAGGFGTFAWQFGDGVSATGASVSHAYATPGNYTVSVRVTDANGIPAVNTTTVQVRDLVVVPLSAPTAGTAGTMLTFAANASGGAGGTYNFTWHFGDGTVAYGPTVTHRYSATGTYDPTLTVTDHLGASRTSAWPGVVVSAAPAPLAWLPVFVLLLLGALLGGVLAVAVYGRRRESERREAASLSRWVPPVGPKGAVYGAKVCPKCGSSNSSLRRSCGVCGAHLPRKAQR